MKLNKTPCVAECFYDKELEACGSCYRTLEEIKNAHVRFKQREFEIKVARPWPTRLDTVGKIWK